MQEDDEESGSSAVEYALIVVCIAALIVLVVYALGGYATGMIDQSCKRFAANTTTGNASSQDC